MWKQSVYVYQRKGKKAKDTLIVVINLTPVYRENYRLGVPTKGKWREIFNSDAQDFDGSNQLNEVKNTEDIDAQRHKQSVIINIPPLGVSIFKKTNRPL